MAHHALRKTKDALSVAVGLGMKDHSYFVQLHGENIDAIKTCLGHLRGSMNAKTTLLLMEVVVYDGDTVDMERTGVLLLSFPRKNNFLGYWSICWKRCITEKRCTNARVLKPSCNKSMFVNLNSAHFCIVLFQRRVG